MNTTLHTSIMRRVYFAFAKRIIMHPIVVQSALFVLALMVFARLVHVHSVIENFLSISVGQVPKFILSALMQGEALTLIAIGVMVFTLLSLPMRIRSAFSPRVQMV